MVKHIVMWKLKDGPDKKERAEKIKRLLEDLRGKIPGLIQIEVGIDFSNTPASADICLYSELESREALQQYQVHPLHEAVKPVVTEATVERRVADYDVD